MTVASSWTSRLRGGLDRMLFQEYAGPARGLALFRIVYASWALLWIGLNLGFTAGLPDSILSPPPGPFLLMHSLPGPGVLQAVSVIRVLSAAALLVGWRTPAASVITSLASIFLSGVLFSFGKIDHTIMVLIVPLILAPSGWGARWSIDALSGRRTTVRAWPLALLAVALGMGYFTGGAAKLLAGWLDPSTQAVQAHVLRNAAVTAREAFLADALIRLDAPWLWELLDYGTVALEMGVVLAAVRLRTYRLGLAGLVILHLAVWLALHINFGNITIVYAAFLPWDRIAARLPLGSRALRYTGGALAAGVITLGLRGALDRRSPILDLARWFHPDAVVVPRFFSLTASSMVVAGWMLLGLRRLARSRIDTGRTSLASPARSSDEEHIPSASPTEAEKLSGGRQGPR